MIDELQVKDVALIQQAAIFPARGLTAVTGETGAGKTALLGALKLLVGERADAGLVREGAERAHVSGRVFPLRAVEGEGAGARAEADEGLVVERTLSADGRSRVHLQGAIASVAELARTVGATVDLCGQHEHQRLLHVREHRAMLDAWGGQEARAAADAYRAAWERHRSACERLEAVAAAAQADEESVERARYVLQRIGEADPQPGEYEAIEQRLPLLENADALMQATAGAHESLSGEGGALEALGQACALLDGAASADAALGALADSLRDASYIIEDVSRDARAYADGVEYDPALLAQLQERLGQLAALVRTFGPTYQAVLDARDEAQERVDAVDGSAERIAQAQAACDDAERALEQAAEALHALRAAAAPQFERAVCAQMARLELGGASLVCAVEALAREEWTADGPDRVEFLFRPGEAFSARPLARIASGGELSRVMLAVKVVLGDRDAAETLVFDEVDAGVGGSAARALAAVLADLAQTHQVIVVTHVAQVAVAAQRHYVVRKVGTQERPATVIDEVRDEARVAEVARMLSGEATDASLQHARSLLAEM